MLRPSVSQPILLKIVAKAVYYTQFAIQFTESFEMFVPRTRANSERPAYKLTSTDQCYPLVWRMLDNQFLLFTKKWLMGQNVWLEPEHHSIFNTSDLI